MPDNEVKTVDSEAIQVAQPMVPVRERASVLLAPVMDLAVARKRLAEFQEFVRDYMEEGTDYGTIPGTPKPTLYKPGADKLCELYGLSDDYIILTQVENFAAEPALFDYTIKCILRSRRDDSLVSTGLGSCSSYESKYKYRETKRKCPVCNQETVIKGKEEYGGGWLCWKKVGKSDGCGMKWPDGAKEIESQPAGKQLNDDIPTLKNTILKMAKKRAKVDATLAATRSSGIFTQDIEDFDNGQPEGSRVAAQAVAKAKIEQHVKANGTPILTFTPTLAGMTYVSGNEALALLKVEIPEDDKKKIIWMPKDKKNAIPNDFVDRLATLCAEHGIDAKLAVAAPGTVEAPSSAVPTIRSVTKGETAKHQPYLTVAWGTDAIAMSGKCFDKKLFKYIEDGLKKPVEFVTQKSKDGKYTNITGIVKIGTTTFSLNQDNEYLPDLMRDPPPIEDSDLPEVLFEP